MDDGNDLQHKLSEVDRKLRQLQDDLSAMGEPLTSEESPHPSASAQPAERAEPPADQRARWIVAQAHADAARILTEAAGCVEAVNRQVDQLRELRSELVRSARALVEEYERAGAPPAFTRGDGSGASAQTFEGEVRLNAGPFDDVTALSAFEDALESLPLAGDVRIRGLQGKRALFDLVLAAPTKLVEELVRRAPHGLRVVSAGPDALTVEMEPAEGRERAGSKLIT